LVALLYKKIYVFLQTKCESMRKVLLLTICSSVLLFSSCINEYNQVYKSDDYHYKYEYAKQAFIEGKYQHAITLLETIVTQEKGTDNGQECLYMLAMSEYCYKDYQKAAEYFKKYYQSYPKGQYAELAKFYVGQSLYMDTPEPRLDQSSTISAISAFQEFLDVFPDAKLKGVAQQRLFDLQDKLVMKELHSAQLYYNLGTYFGNCTSGGNNYEACIVTSENALKDYPFMSKREDFSVLIMKSKYELARQSVEAKKLERFQDAEDECYGFINEFPDSKERPLAEKYIEKCKEVTKD